ncbi:MAG: transporter substrate-binding domain-containing protein [Rubrivivax sp.]|nr:transporter substrate-binding domain-containing protein [Rubrivivax sp.]
MRPARRTLLAGLAASVALPVLGQPAAESALARVRQRGRLTVGLYNDMPPFHVAGKGIDVDLATALAERLGVAYSPLPFNADENMNDDLRNMVWRGHYLGFGPADVLMHVPVDRPLMQANPRVEIFGPYWRERIVIARDLSQVPVMASLDDFAGRRIAVPGQTLAGWLLIGAEGGKYREQLTTKWKDGVDAAEALRRGEVAGAAGMASELESTLAGDTRFVVEPLPVPRARDGWPVGMAVKKDAADLAQALQGALNGLAQSGQLAQIFARGRLSWRAA